MGKLKFKLDRKSLETIYIAFSRPLLEYGDVIWDNYTQYKKNEPEKMKMKQRELHLVQQNLFH